MQKYGGSLGLFNSAYFKFALILPISILPTSILFTIIQQFCVLRFCLWLCLCSSTHGYTCSIQAVS